MFSPISATENSNPFIRISPLSKKIIVFYFFTWRFLPLAAELVHALGEFSFPYVSSLLLKLATQCLLLFPFLKKSLGGTPIGWLHPFVFPALVSVGLTWLRSPGSILEPFIIFGSQFLFSHPLISHWNLDSIREVQFKESAISILSLLSTYAGYLWWRFHFNVNLRIPKSKDWLIVSILVAIIALVFYFLQQQGGIIGHMQAFAGGRFGLRTFTGHFLVLSNFLPYLLIFWYFYNTKIMSNKFFLILFLFVCLLQFVVTGSRSAIFVPVAALIAAHSLRSMSMYLGRFLVIALVASIFIGSLGDVRSSGRKGQVSFDSLLNTNIFEQWEATQQDIEGRSRGTSLAVAALVPQDVGFLYGSSYISSVLFWVPRSIWQDKPRGIGAHVAALLYEGRVSTDDYEGASFPVNAGSESYWNFSWPGVAFIFFVYGSLVKLICKVYLSNQRSPASDTLFILFLFGFSSPSTETMVTFQQNLVLLLLLIFLLKVSFSRLSAGESMVKRD